MFRSIFNVKPNSIRYLTTEAVNSQWVPKKRVSRPTMEKIRALAATQPEVYDIVQLSKEFTLSTEAIRRILKSKYVPSGEDAERQEKNRYEAMGERRKEFRVKYNIPEDKEKTFWKRDQCDAPSRKAINNGTWSNDTYKKRNTSFDSRLNQDQDPVQDRRGGFISRSRGADDETRSFRQKDHNEGSFRQNENNISFRQNDDSRRPFRQNDDSRRPFRQNEDSRRPFRHNDGSERPYRRNNGEEKESFYSRPSYNRGDNEERPYRRRSNYEGNESFSNKQRSYNNRRDTEESPYRGDNDQGSSFNKQRSYNNRGDAVQKSYRRENNGDGSFRSRSIEERSFRRENDGNRSFKSNFSHEGSSYKGPKP